MILAPGVCKSFSAFICLSFISLCKYGLGGDEVPFKQTLGTNLIEEYKINDEQLAEREKKRMEPNHLQVFLTYSFPLRKALSK